MTDVHIMTLPREVACLKFGTELTNWLKVHAKAINVVPQGKGWRSVSVLFWLREMWWFVIGYTRTNDSRAARRGQHGERL